MGSHIIVSARRRALFGATCSVIALLASTSAAQSATEHEIVLASQPLEEALVAIGQTYGVTIVAPDSLTVGKTTEALRGTHTVEGALASLLTPAGLTTTTTTSGAIIITQQESGGPQPAEENDDTIIVTGTKQNLSVQDTQASVSVVTDEIIDKQAIFELTDIFLRTANVTQTNGAFAFSIRGINSGGVGSAGTGRTSNVYVDGAPASLNGLSSAFNLWDVSQVEILRGPQSTTQGRNALAGAVIIQSADPEYEFGARARVLAGNNETYQFSGMATGPIIDNQLAYRVSIDYREQDFDTFNGTVMVPEGDSDALTARGKLLIEPNAVPDLRVELNLQYVEFDTTGDGSGVIGPAPGTPEAANFDPFDRVNFDARAGVVDNENMRFVADVAYEFTPNWSGALLATYDDTERLITNTGGDDLREEETYTVDARAIFDYDRLTGWIGGYYFNEDLVSGSDQFFDVTQFGAIIDPPGTTVQLIQDRAAETENYAIYGDLLFAVNDRISLNVGARYDWEDAADTGFSSETNISSDPCFVSLGLISGPCAFFLPASSDGVQGGATFEAFLPRGGIIYNFDDNRSLSFMVQRGYRAGGFNIEQGEVVQFDAEYITNYELAWRSVFFNDRLTLNANAFYSDWTDQQISIPLPGTFDFQILNAGSSELYGLEAEASFEVTPEFEIYGNLGLVETEFTDFPFTVDADGNPLPLVDAGGNPIADPNANPFADLSGNEFGGAPSVTGTLGVSYEGTNGIFGSANLSYRGEQYTDITNLEANRTDDYALVNARLGYQKDGWRISAFVDNLFDDEFFRAITTEEVTQADIMGTRSAVLGPASIQRFNFSQPRHFGVELEFEY
ncbi:MAG: TonB-dependent receptor [Pseudomonadota bacterium]